jgi:hypothetical protein
MLAQQNFKKIHVKQRNTKQPYTHKTHKTTQKRCGHKRDALWQNDCKEFIKLTNKNIFPAENVISSKKKKRRIHAS